MHIIVGIITALIIFAILVIVHEGGHFFTAKAVGIKVNEFAIGMGPLIFQKETKETKYSVRAFPIGGYVAMEGEDSESDDERAFNNKPAWARALVIAAGPVMNFILAVVVLGVMITYMGTSLSPVLADVTQGMPAYEAGIRKGDRIVSVNGENVSDGTETRELLSEAMAESDRVSVGVESGGETKTLQVGVEQDADGNRMIGVVFDVNHNIIAGMADGLKSAVAAEKLMFEALGDIITGQGAAGDVVGPIGIVNIVDQSVQVGLMNVIYLLALLSLNLALVNILPFPALDGGRLLFIVIRKITGKAVSDELEGKIHLIGMAILFSLMIFITLKDFNMFILKN